MQIKTVSWNKTYNFEYLFKDKHFVFIVYSSTVGNRIILLLFSYILFHEYAYKKNALVFAPQHITRIANVKLKIVCVSYDYAFVNL